MKEADALAQNGQNEAALAAYLALFDQGNADPAFSGVRVSFLLGAIVRLGEAYPPAADALRQRRDDAQARVDKVGLLLADPLVVMDLASLNRVLGDSQRNAQLHEDLKTADPDSVMLEYVGSIANVPAGKPRFNPARDPAAITLAVPAGANGANDAVRQPYVLEAEAHHRGQAGETSADDRLAKLRERWDKVRLAVAYVNVASDMAFHRCIALWSTGYVGDGWAVNQAGDLLESSTASGNFQIEGDARAEIHLPAGGFVLILGDLASTVKVGGQSEIVIGGDVTEAGHIEADGITQVFVGGSVQGEIRSAGSVRIWVNGNYTAGLVTGSPKTDLTVMGDFRGAVSAGGRAALLAMDIRGFIAEATLKDIAALGYTQFQASAGTSDVAPGMYASRATGTTHWVVHQEVTK